MPEKMSDQEFLAKKAAFLELLEAVNSFSKKKGKLRAVRTALRKLIPPCERPLPKHADTPAADSRCNL